MGGLGEEYRKGSGPLNFSLMAVRGKVKACFRVTLDLGTGCVHQQELFHGS